MSGYCIIGANEEIGHELQMRGWQWSGEGCYRYESADLSVAMQVAALLKGYPVPEGCRMLTYTDSVDLRAVTSGAPMAAVGAKAASQSSVRVSSDPSAQTTSGSYVTNMPQVSRRAQDADVTMLMPVLDSDGIPVASSAADSLSNMILAGAFDDELFGTEAISEELSDASTVAPSAQEIEVEVEEPAPPRELDPDQMDDEEAYNFEMMKALGLR